MPPTRARSYILQPCPIKLPTSQAGSILTPYNSCNLIPPMCGTKQVGTWSEMRSDNHTQPRTNLHPQGGLVLIVGQMRPPKGHQQPPRRTPQPILKFQPRHCFNYRVRYEPQLSLLFMDTHPYKRFNPSFLQFRLHSFEMKKF